MKKWLPIIDSVLIFVLTVVLILVITSTIHVNGDKGPPGTNGTSGKDGAPGKDGAGLGNGQSSNFVLDTAVVKNVSSSSTILTTSIGIMIFNGFSSVEFARSGYYRLGTVANATPTNATQITLTISGQNCVIYIDTNGDVFLQNAGNNIATNTGFAFVLTWPRS